ncbi:hypothetical protein JCM10449v2_006089 [Rhodotorula kratochvilovae]
MATIRPLHALISSSGSPASRSSSSLLTAPLVALADPAPLSADARLVDLLADEMLRALRDSERAARERGTRDLEAVDDELAALGLAVDDAPRGALRGDKTLAGRERQEDADKAVCARLDDMGFKVGWATAERLARDRPRFPSLPVSAPTTSSPSPSVPPTAPEPLEVVKFICKDVWSALYDKQVDNLRTNHRGVYVLLDQSLRGLRTLSTPEGREEDREAERWVRQVLAFPSGIIRGALANLGVQATVTGESAGLPQATFQIKTSRPGAI